METQFDSSLASTTSVSVVLLAHNEVEIIETVVRDFYTAIIEKIPHAELIVAEDGSTDGTKEILASLVREFPKLRWEEGKERRGYVYAFKRALGLATFDWILLCDLSGKHEPRDFWKMLPHISDHDLIIGYKENRADPLYRIWLTRVFNFLVNRYFVVNFRDANCPFRLIRKTAWLSLKDKQQVVCPMINFEYTLRFSYAGYRIKQIPVIHRPRSNGPSRGLPFKIIPRIVYQLLSRFKSLKKEMMGAEYQNLKTAIQSAKLQTEEKSAA